MTMTSMKRFLALLLMAALLAVPAFTLAESDAADTATETTETAEDPNEVLVTVNGVDITRERFNTYYNSMVTYYSSYYDTTDESLLAYLRQYALSIAIEYELIDQKATELNLDLTEEERTSTLETAQANWQSVLDSGLEYMGITDESTEDERAEALVEVLSMLEAEGYTEEIYYNECIESARYNKVMTYLVQDITVTDEEVEEEFNTLVAADKETYEGNISDYENTQYMNTLYAAYGYTDYVTPLYYQPSGYRGISHILLSVDDTLLETYTNLLATYEEQQDQIEAGEEVTDELVTYEQVEEAKQAIIDSVQPTIDEINEKLANGESFEDLILEYGQDSGMEDETTRAEGYSVHMDSTSYVSAFTEGAFTMENVGDISEPIVSDYGVHILKYVRDVPSGAVELTTDIMDTIRADLLSTKQNEHISEVVLQWEDESTIVYSDAGLDIMPATVDNEEDTTSTEE
jgi:parvulin-like peptidyl-prolyl isomerase